MRKKIALALSVGVILSLGGGYAYAETPVAYVSMDINPSVELGVNAFDKVISVEAYNEDGKKILEGTDLINYDINNAVSTVISNAISDGYINKDVTTTSAVAVAIEITTSTDKEDVATELDESLKEVAEETLDNNDVEVEVETEKVALTRRDEARKLGITPGKLNLIQKLQKLEPTITVEDYKDSSVKDIQKKTKELRKNNRSDETTIDDSTSTDTSVDVATEENIQEATLSETSISSEKTTIVEPEKNKNSSNNKDNNVNSKKEENSNSNEEKKTTITEKQNNGNNVNSKENNSSNSESKSSNSNSSSENKGKSKNN